MGTVTWLDFLEAFFKALWQPELLMGIGKGLLMIIGGLAQMMIPVVFIGGIIWMIVRNVRRNRKIAMHLANDFPEIRCPSNHMEAVIKGVQQSMRK